MASLCHRGPNFPRKPYSALKVHMPPPPSTHSLENTHLLLIWMALIVFVANDGHDVGKAVVISFIVFPILSAIYRGQTIEINLHFGKREKLTSKTMWIMIGNLIYSIKLYILWVNTE